MSLNMMEKSTGPRTVPWGTPRLTGKNGVLLYLHIPFAGDLFDYHRQHSNIHYFSMSRAS